MLEKVNDIGGYQSNTEEIDKSKAALVVIAKQLWARELPQSSETSVANPRRHPETNPNILGHSQHSDQVISDPATAK